MFPFPMHLLSQIPGLTGQIGPQAPPQMGPPMPQRQGIGAALGGKIGQFTDNLDQTFQSPSKQLGLGLLGQLHPGLALGGLLAGGIFGGRRGN